MSKRIPLSGSWRKEHLPNTKPGLTECPICCLPAIYLDYPDNHPWAKRLLCNCGRDWLVCAVCQQQRVHIITHRQITRHVALCSSKVVGRENMKCNDTELLTEDAATLKCGGGDEEEDEVQVSLISC